MSNSTAIEVEHLSYKYNSRPALRDISFTVGHGEIFGLLGPNGGGKSTLFRILSTFLLAEKGSVRVLNLDARQRQEIRQKIGVVFQSSSLDRKLSVQENLIHQGHLYGLGGTQLRAKIGRILNRFGLSERSGELVETLSGGLRRRAEIAKSMLHEPELLLLDEPSSGLDPAVRLEVWRYLKELRDQDGVTVLLTTHFMEEGERCDRLAILDEGRLIVQGTPAALKEAIGGEVLTVHANTAEEFSELLRKRFGLQPVIINGAVRIELANGHEWVPRLVGEFSSQIDSITVGKPTLEDVFIHYTGHRLE